MEKVKRQTLVMGCDPELFFTDKRGSVVASEKVIPQYLSYTNGKITQDGVQVELNPNANSCRQVLSRNVANLISSLDGQAKNKGLKVGLDVTKKVTKRHFDEISDGCKQFGCAESYNIYKTGANKVSEIKADPMVDRERSTGGHIHLGDIGEASPQARLVKKALFNYKRLVPLLDILVGNTLVILDNRKGNKERRENYGRAGEFRPTSYGVEYRVPSNIWLKSYAMFSFTFAMSRFAVEVLASSNPSNKTSNGWEKKLREAVRMADIKRAINDNDQKLAMANYKKIEPVILEMTNVNFPIHKDNYRPVRYFLKKGVDYWFKKDFIDAWKGRTDPFAGSRYKNGWESFITNSVKRELDTMYTKKRNEILDEIIKW